MKAKAQTQLAVLEWMDPFTRAGHDGSWFSYKANTLWIEHAEYDESLGDVVRHEIGHFMMHCSTPYGHLLDELCLFQNNQFLSFVTQALGEIYCPVYEVAKLLLKDRQSFPARFGDSETFNHLVNEYVRPWTDALLLERVLEGLDLPSVRALKISGAIRLLENVERALLDTLPDTDLFASRDAVPTKKNIPMARVFGKLDDEACEQACLMQGRAFPLGAHHIFEGLAQMFEPGTSFQDVVYSPHASTYAALWIYTFKSYGIYQVRNETDFRRVLLTFYALCDLALFTPVGALYGRLRQESFEWRDLHPASRFLKSLCCVAANKLWIDRLEDLKRLHCDIAKRLEWPSPVAFLELGANVTYPHFSRHAEACSARLEEYGCFVDFESASQPKSLELFYKHRPLLHWRGGTVPAAGATGGLIDYFLSRFSYQIMLGSPCDPHELLPPSFSFDSHWINIDDADSFLDIVWSSLPQLRKERFLPMEVNSV